MNPTTPTTPKTFKTPQIPETRTTRHQRFIPSLAYVALAALSAWPVARLARASEADDGGVGRSEAAQSTSEERYAEIESHPWRIYGGVATGYGNVTGSEYNHAADGPQYQFNGLLAYQIPRWVFDAGAGWMYSKLSGDHAAQQPISLRTRAGFADVSARYRLTPHWQIGPAYNRLFGTDTSFGSSVGSTVANDLVGLRLVYEMAAGYLPLRFVAQGLTDVGTPGRQYTLATIGVQIGLPFGGRANPASGADVATRGAQAAGIRGDSADNEVRLDLTPEKIFFSTESAKIRPGAQNILERIGAYLASHNDQWTSLTLAGHADQRGTAELNDEVSSLRAASVREELVAHGAAADKIQLRAYGFRKPVDPANNPKAWAKNRRVEFILRGVKDPAELRRMVDELASFRPDGSGRG